MSSKMKSSLLVFLCLLFPFSSFLIAYVDEDSKELAISQEERFIRQGKEYYSKGNLLRAKAMFELALKEDPNNKIAKAYLLRIDSSLAGSAMMEDPSKIEEIYSQGKRAFIEGDYQRAAELFSEVLKCMPNHQYAKMYLERAQAHLAQPKSDGLDFAEYTRNENEISGDISDPSVLKTKLKVALISLQEELLQYFQSLSELKQQQDALIKKYLEEKEKRVKELENRVKEQSDLLDRLSSERLKLQTEIARIDEEILFLERRLSNEFYRRTGNELSWEDIKQLDEMEASLTAEEKRLQRLLKQELELRRELERELKRIEDKIKEQGQRQVQLSREVAAVKETRPLLEGGEKSKHAKRVSVSRKELRRLYAEGKKAYREKDYRTAIEKLSKVVTLAPTDRLSRAAKKLLEKAKAKQQEIELAQKVLLEKTKRKLDLFAEAQDAYFNGDFSEAIALCEQILKIDPDYAPARELKKLALLSKEEKIISELSEKEGNRRVESQKGRSFEIQVPSYRDKVKAKLAAIKEEAKQRREEYISQRLSEIKALMKKGDLDKAEELLLRLVRLYPDEKTPVKLLEQVRVAKKEQAFAEALDEINELMEKKEYVLASEKLDSLIRKYPDKRDELFALKKELQDLFIQPYVEEIEGLLGKGDIESVRCAVNLASKAVAKYPDVSKLRELRDDADRRLKKLEEKERRIREARDRMLEGLREEVIRKGEMFKGDDKIVKVVDAEQERYRREFYEEVLDRAKEQLEIGELEKVKDLVALLEDAPERYREAGKKLAREVKERELEREFEKHIELAKSALKVYDFASARSEIEKAKCICPKFKNRLRAVINELKEREKFYKVQQALKTAQMYLQHSDFVSAKIIVKDVLRNIDPNNRYAKEMLRQIEKAESLYYADIKLRQGIMALKAGDYASAVRLAKEGLNLNKGSKDLWDLYRRAKSRWRTEILRRKGLIRQIEEAAAKKRRMRLASQQVEHKRLEFGQEIGLLKADVQGMLKQARRLMEEQKFDRAISLCQKVLEYYPDNVKAQALLDLIILTQQEIEKKKEKAEGGITRNELGKRKTTKLAYVKQEENKVKVINKISEGKKHSGSGGDNNGKRLGTRKNVGMAKGKRIVRDSSVSKKPVKLVLDQRLLSMVRKEVSQRANFLNKGIRELMRKCDREIKRLSERQLHEEISSRLAQAKKKLKTKQFELAERLVDEVLEISPKNRSALTLRRKIKRLHQRELKRIAKERKLQEKQYRLARERMMRDMEREISSRGRNLSLEWEKLAKKLDKERWILAKAQREKEIEERLNTLDTLLTQAKEDWEKTDVIAKEISQLQKMEDFTPEQKRRLRSLAKKFAHLMAKIEQEKAKVRERVNKRLTSMRLAQGGSQSDVPDKSSLIRDMLSNAREALVKGDYERVLKICEDVLDIAPENKTAVALSEKARRMLERETELRKRQAVLQEEKYPKLREVYERAKEAYEQGNYVESRSLFRQVYQEEKKLGISYYSPYAKEYLDLIKEREKDIKALNREKETEELKSKIVEKLYEDAKRFEQQGKYNAAASVYENILFLFPNDKKAKAKLFNVKEKMFALEKEALERKMDEKDKEMLAEVMKSGIVPTELKKKEVDIEERRKRRLINLPPIKKKLQQKVTANFEDVPLIDVLRFFAKQTGVNIIPSASVLAQDYKVTIDITDMPLESALKYLLKSYSLTYQIDEDAVWITTPDQLEKEPMETKVYHLNKGIGLYSKFTLTTTGTVDLGSGASVSEVKTLKDILQEAVDWPSGSKLVLDERTASLIVTNTPANIKKIEEILWNLDVTPIQVLIEAKFLEVDVTDLKEIGVQWKIANEDWAVESKGGEMKHGVAKDSGFSFPEFGNASSGLNLTYKGVLTKPQFQAVLHALMQTQHTRTLSSPRVTTLNNQMATIKVVDEWIYPTRYEFQIVQFDINGDGDYDDAGETRYENVPTDFVKRDVGIILRVTPSVGDDLKTISLSLLPEVSDATKNYFEYTGGVSLPKFTSRTLSTNVVVDNTDTVVLGGLIKENRTKVLTKVPILGDIPLLGQVFRKTSDEVNRRNLLIFVTATIIDPEGDTLVAK